MDAPKLHFREVKPIGTHTGMGFVEYSDPRRCSLEPITSPTYPDSPTGQLMRDLRVTLGVSLRDASKALGLAAAELSGLEMGRLELVDEAGGFQEVVRRYILLADRPRKALTL